MNGTDPVKFEIKYRSQALYEKLLLISKILCLILAVSILVEVMDLRKLSKPNVS